MEDFNFKDINKKQFKRKDIFSESIKSDILNLLKKYLNIFEFQYLLDDNLNLELNLLKDGRTITTTFSPVMQMIKHPSDDDLEKMEYYFPLVRIVTPFYYNLYDVDLEEEDFLMIISKFKSIKKLNIYQYNLSQRVNLFIKKLNGLHNCKSIFIRKIYPGWSGKHG